MSYKIVRKSQTEFHIYEIATEQTIGIFESHESASVSYRRLKKGLAFNGWTPSFFLTSVKGYI